MTTTDNADIKIDYAFVQGVLDMLADREDHRAMVATTDDDISTFRKREDAFRVSSRLVADYVAARTDVDKASQEASNPNDLQCLQMTCAALHNSLHWANDERRDPNEYAQGLRTKLLLLDAVKKMMEAGKPSISSLGG